MSYAELIAYAAGETDEMTSAGIDEYLATHAEDAAVVKRVQILSGVVRYLFVWQPSEYLMARAKSIYGALNPPA